MESPIQRKLVPRFRRRNQKLVDADDDEAQALIDKDLKSEFRWTSDTIDESKYQFDNSDDQQIDEKQIWICDDSNKDFVYDIQNEHQWKMNVEQNENKSIQWTHDQQQNKISLSIDTIQHKEQQWTLDDKHQQNIQLNLLSHDDQQCKHDLETNNQNQQQTFIRGDAIKIQFSIQSENDQLNIFPIEREDIKTISFDSNIPSADSRLSLPQPPVVFNWIEGISQYSLSLPVQLNPQEYSPLTQIQSELDSTSIKSLKWSLDLLKENLLVSYLLSLPNTQHDQLSLPETFRLKLSIDETNNKQLFSLTDFTFNQTLSLSSNDIKQQLLTIIDSFQIKQNFGKDDQELFYQWTIIEQLKSSFLNLSPVEIIQFIYSPIDAKQVLLEHILIDSDEISARALRRYRCKHMSIKSDNKDQLDSDQGLHLIFKGNEEIAIGEQQIQNDLDEQQFYRDVTDCNALLNDNHPQSYDITSSDSSSSNLGPCLFRSDYEREPPKTWSSLRREIGHISYDASHEEPVYYLDKSFKRFVHIPLKRDSCSYNVYRGYSEFIEKVRTNCENYFRPFDSTDLRPLLSWYSQKQYLFSSTNQNLLKPPTFICRRLVLRTILANLYCDSDPWKLLVVRIKGQFYLALANSATKRVEDMTEDEFSGYKFEALFTSQQPNTTRLQEKTPLEKPQEQFHTVQYWQFGEYNILYSNEIDGELNADMQEKPASTETTNLTKQEADTTKARSTEKPENQLIKSDWLDGEIPNEIEISSEEIEDESKRAQIDENLKLISNDENEITEKKKLNEFELKSGYVEMKCTNKKIFYRDENKLKTLHWWAQMWLANINTLMIGYKASNDGSINHLELLSIRHIISKFLSKYDLHLKYSISYLYSFFNLIKQTVIIDDPNTVHAFTYIPQPLEIDPQTGKPLQIDLPKCVPFRYTQMKRSNKRHSNFIPQSYLQHLQRTIPIGGVLQDTQLKTVEQETKKRLGHRGRSSCLLKQQQDKHKRKQK